ncbi:hypothetical protein ACFQ1L_35990 [Phytohabitans flavus]|uniref:hypothetical protein n=1 Tax=Phytohabitans flavus TaxID=1076124 RepID=UPI0031F1B407
MTTSARGVPPTTSANPAGGAGGVDVVVLGPLTASRPGHPAARVIPAARAAVASAATAHALAALAPHATRHPPSSTALVLPGRVVRLR